MLRLWGMEQEEEGSGLLGFSCDKKGPRGVGAEGTVTLFREETDGDTCRREDQSEGLP